MACVGSCCRSAKADHHNTSSEGFSKSAAVTGVATINKDGTDVSLERPAPETSTSTDSYCAPKTLSSNEMCSQELRTSEKSSKCVCCSPTAAAVPGMLSGSSTSTDHARPELSDSCCSPPKPVDSSTTAPCCSIKSRKQQYPNHCCNPPKPSTSSACCLPLQPATAKCMGGSKCANGRHAATSFDAATKAVDFNDEKQSASKDTLSSGCNRAEKTDMIPSTTPAPKISGCTLEGTENAIISQDLCCLPSGGVGCCSEKEIAVVDNKEITSINSETVDAEKGGVAYEHVAISVSGMTCTGCETKLKRTLGGLSYISNLQTSLVLGRVELDLKANLATAEDVVKHLHRTTEFKCEVVSNQGCHLDLICSRDPTVLVNSQWPEGVLNIRMVGKETVRVEYDPKVLGARDLLNHPWSQSLRLAPPCLDPSLSAGSKHVRNMGLLTLVSTILTIPVLVMAWAPLPEKETAYGSASLALATIVQVAIAGPFYPTAIKALVFSRVIEMDLLIVLSTSAAYIFSVVSFGYLIAGSPLSTGEFFETSTLLVTLIMVGRWVASLARQKATESISIRSLQTPTAILVDETVSHKEIDARLLQFGDVFEVAPDTRIPTDGTVISGSSEIDESMLTGESSPVEKYVGSTVIAGSINGNGTLTVRLTRLPCDNTITTIASMVDEAKLSKPKIQRIADTVASYFVPVVVILAIITFVIWIAIGVAIRHQSGSRATTEAITYAITVLIVSCPCAIGLAVPMVIVVASGVAAKRGVVFKSASSIEVAYKTTDVVFDKTGTLTGGQLAVVHEGFLRDDANTTRPLLLGLLRNIKHPVAAAVADHLTSLEVLPLHVSNVKVVTGKGVEGEFDGKMLRAGNSRWLRLSDHPHVQSLLAKGVSTFCFTVDDALVAIFGLQDTLRADAIPTVDYLHCAGIRVHILSGDDDGAVKAIATQLNVTGDMVRSRCSPGDKQAYIQALLTARPTNSSSRKPYKPIVMFVGDGTNDAVALAQATLGVHMSSGTDIAQSAADVVLVRTNLSGVLTIMNISRKAMRTVAFNFGWSFVYNLFAVLLATGAFVHARIPPEFAGLGELISVLPVVLAAVLLRWSHV